MKNNIMNKSCEISNWILTKINPDKGDTISPLKLQKLLYYCQAWHLAIFKTPLFEEEVEAWVHGPVIPSQYNRFSHIRMNDSINIEDIKQFEEVSFNDETLNLLNEVFSVYNEHSASYLEDLTHSEQPWIKARGDLKHFEKSNNIISKESMMKFYSELNKDE